MTVMEKIGPVEQAEIDKAFSTMIAKIATIVPDAEQVWTYTVGQVASPEPCPCGCSLDLPVSPWVGEPLEVTMQVALQLLDAVVAERGPDYRYSQPSAHYVDVRDGTPVGSCLVGVALAKLGVPLEAMARVNRNNVLGLARELERAGIARFTRQAVEVLQVAQTLQDRGLRWGLAVADAREAAAGLPVG